MINLQDMDNKSVSKEIYTKDISKMDSNMEKASIYGLMVQLTKEIGFKEKQKGEDHINKMMAEYMKVNGKTI